MAGFAAATAVRARGDGGYDAQVDPQWTIGGKPNGGYLLAMLARAGTDAVQQAGGDHPHPMAASAHYLAAPDAAPAEIRVDVLRKGRSASQVRTQLHQGGRLCVEALMTVGRLETGSEPWWSSAPPVDLPAEDECFLLPPDPPGGGYRVDILDVVEERLDPAVLGWAAGNPSGAGEIRGWLRLADRTEPDPLLVLVALDALPPATFDLGTQGWVPTLELTAYVRALPAPGPLRVRMRARHVEAGLVDETCDVWDSRGRLVGQATQLAGIRVPEP